jgi:hypothetical protein
MEAPMSFEEWMAEIDKLLLGSIGLGHMDLADAPYNDHWRSGTEPRDMVAIVLVEWNDMEPELAEELGFSL